MADPCTPCMCVPYTNICCCPPQGGISVFQPTCQMLPNGSVVNNPCFDTATGISTWTYKFFTDCTPGNSVNAINYILIPVCGDITPINLVVEERIDGCGQFNQVAFTLNANDSIFGPVPPGFNWLKIENSGRYDKGVYVEYRIRISGDFPVAAQPVRIRAGQNRFTFSCQQGCYKVPGCAIPGQLALKKECKTLIQNNTAALQYNITLSNPGGSALTNVQYQDIINYDVVNVTLGQIMVSPGPPLQTNTAAPGMVLITGTFASLAPKQEVPISYTIPLTSFAQPGTFVFSNIVSASSGSTAASDTCSTAIDAVRVRGEKTSVIINGNHAAFKVVLTSVGTSPEARVNISDQLIIPPGIVVQFTDFSECTATLQNDGPVPLNNDITDATINISCSNVTIPALGGVQASIEFTIVSTSAFQNSAVITNTLQQVTGANPNQIFLTPQNIPVTASLDVRGAAISYET